MTENEIAYQIRGAIFTVYNALGPGLFESVYERALSIELQKQGMHVRIQVPFIAYYNGVEIGEAFRMDMLVNDKVIVELKSVESLQLVHHKQLITYLKLTGLKLGLLVNFNTSDLNKDIIRKANKLEERSAESAEKSARSAGN